jgi:hypothetical protein
MVGQYVTRYTQWQSLPTTYTSCDEFPETIFVTIFRKPYVMITDFPETICDDYRFKSHRHIEAKRCIKVGPLIQGCLMHVVSKVLVVWRL